MKKHKNNEENNEEMSNIDIKELLLYYRDTFYNEYNERFKLFRNYLECVKGPIILNQNFLKIHKNKSEKLAKRIFRDEITIRIRHFLDNTNFFYTINKIKKNKYTLSFENENSSSINPFLTIKSKLFKSSNKQKFLKK